MRIHSITSAALAAAVALSPFALPAQGFNCQLLGTQNLHPTYANVWGYVAPNGKEYALLGCNGGTSIVDCTVPTNPIERAFIPGASSAWRELNTYLHYCYVCTEAGGAGIQVIDLSNPDAPFLANTFGQAQFNNCHTITCDTQTGRIYCNGTNNGTAVFDASVNPVNPTFVGYMTPGGQSNYFHDFHVRNGFGYASMIYNGVLRIYDMSVWPPVALSSSTTPSSFTHNAWTNATSTVCATTDERNGSVVKFWDITNRAAPVGLSTYTVNPNSVPHNAYIVGNLCHVSWYTEGYVLLDITDPANPVRVAQYDTWPGASGGFNGAWGVYPFQPSGNVYILDISTGLYIVRPQVTDMTIGHVALADTQEESEPYQVVADVQSSHAISSVSLSYRVGESGPFTSVPMTPVGTSTLYTAAIPAQDAVTRIQYHIDAVDAQAARRSPASGEHAFLVGAVNTVWSDDFEQNLGWTHGMTAGQDDWQRGAPAGRTGTSGGFTWADPSSAHSGTNCWANDLGGTGFNGSYANNVGNWLQSPAIPTGGATGLTLRFRRWLSLANLDTARILVNGTNVFTTSTATQDSAWQLVEIDVAALLDAATTATIRFELTTNGSNVAGGWAVDDVELVQYVDAAPPRLYGNATPGTPGAPGIAMSAPARIGTTTQILGSNLLPNAPAILAINFADTLQVLGGIEVLVQPVGAAVLFSLSSGAGQANWPFTVPNNPAFDNFYFYSQLFVLDAGAANGTAAASQGMRYRVALR